MPFFPGITIPSGGFFAQRLAAQVDEAASWVGQVGKSFWIPGFFPDIDDEIFFLGEPSFFWGVEQKHDVLQIVL